MFALTDRDRVPLFFHSVLPANITITIRRIIIRIQDESACIRAIIRIPAHNHDLKPDPLTATATATT
jgi:hypothetical protein